MYAIIRAGGKQAKVQEGDVIDVERLKASDEITFIPLLIVGDDGTVISDRDALQNAKVIAEVVGERRGEKIDIFKYKSKTGYRRHQGHRQTYTTIQVTKIETPGAKTPSKKAAAKKAPDAAAPAVAEAAADQTVDAGLDVAAEAQPKPKADPKPKAEAKPGTEAGPKATAKPKAEPKLKADPKPKAAAKPKATAAKKPATKSVADAAAAGATDEAQAEAEAAPDEEA